MILFVDPYDLNRALRDGLRTTFSVAGNVIFSAGTVSSARSDITFSNANGVSFGLNAAGVITASVAPGAGAGTGFTTATTPGTNIVGTLGAGGLSMGIPAYLTTAQPPGAYLTTAMSSNQGTDFVQATANFFGTNASGTIASNAISVSVAAPSGVGAGTGFTTATTVGTNIVGTLSTNGLSMGVPAYLTTAALSGAISALNISAGTTSSNVSAVTFSNGSGVSFGYDGTNVTASIATTYAGTGFTTATTAGTAVVATLNTSGLSMGIPAYLTTGAAFTPSLDQVLDPATSKLFAMGTDLLNFFWVLDTTFSLVSTNEALFEIEMRGNVTTECDIMRVHQLGTSPTILDVLHIECQGSNVTGLRINAAASVAAEMGMPIKFTSHDSDFTSIGSVPFIMGTVMSNSVANLNANYVQGKGSAVLAGTGFSTATTAGANIVGTLQTNGLSMGVPAYLTVAAAGGVAISNSQSLFSTGTVGFSAGGGAITIAGSTSVGGQSLMFSVPQTSSIIGSGITVSTNVSTISIIAPATSSIVGLGGISISTNGSTITISYSSSNTSAPTLGYFENLPTFPTNTTTVSASGSVIQIVPFIVPQPISMAFLRIPASFSFVSTSHTSTLANTSYTFNRSYSVAAVIYSNAGGNMSQIQAFQSSFASFVFQTSITAGNTGSQYTLANNVTYPVSGVYSNYATSVAFTNVSLQISTGSMTLFTGLRWLDIPFATSLSAGNYWIGIGGSSNSASNGGPGPISAASMAPISMYAHSQTNLTFIRPGIASTSSVQVQPGLGSFSTNALQSTNGTVAMSNISMQVSNPKLYFQMIWST